MITIQDVKQEEPKGGIIPPPPPPVPNFNLSAFNIFVLNKSLVYYYFEPGFVSKQVHDEYTTDRMNTDFLNRGSFVAIKDTLDKLVKAGIVKKDKVWLAVKDYDTILRNKALDEILLPSGLNSVHVGYITDELHTLLKSVK